MGSCRGPRGCHLSLVAARSGVTATPLRVTAAQAQTYLPWPSLLSPKEIACCLLRTPCCTRQAIKQNHHLTAKNLANKGQLLPNNPKSLLAFSGVNHDKIHQKHQSYRRLQKQSWEEGEKNPQYLKGNNIKSSFLIQIVIWNWVSLFCLVFLFLDYVYISKPTVKVLASFRVPNQLTSNYGVDAVFNVKPISKATSWSSRYRNITWHSYFLPQTHMEKSHIVQFQGPT